MKYNYPGNIRELENIIERAVVLSRGSYITVHDLPPQVEQKPRSRLFDPHDIKGNYEEKMKSFEREMILKALAENGGNQTNAADFLGISERRLRYRMEKLSIRNLKATHA